ncbi:hypothetical protein [Pseudocitrobacter faecalis]|uniref:hypothetical protein n=1 Tax=Pseudocitrobacter faecalis TaxID=1398493 RepID=UPI00389AD003
MDFKKTLIGLVGLIFISLPFAAKCSQLKNLNDYSVMLCGKVSNKILDDIGEYKARDKKSEMVDLLILISNDEPNGVSETRVISNGEIYFKGGGTMNFDASFIMTINGGVHTDTVTYISKKNKIIGGYFYNDESKTDKPKEVYISNTGAVYHINIESVSDDKCLDKFK